ncbi:MAG: DMT family transporter [Ignavibacteria bacterium]|nr:DMT family transporter [Ignavibacteria bacterium]
MLGELSALTASVLWSISPYIFTAIVKRIGSFVVNVARLFISTNLMCLTLIVLNVELNFNAFQIVYFALSALIGLAIGDTFLFKALKELGARYTLLIMSSNPAIGAILAFIVFGEIISFLGIIGMLVTIAGIVVVILFNKNEVEVKGKIYFKGVVFAIASALFQAVGLIFTKLAFFEAPIHPFFAAFLRMFPAFLALLIAGMITKKVNFGTFRIVFGKGTALLILVGSFIGSFLGITLSYVAVSYTEVGVAATLMSLQPVLMLPISKFIQKEKLTYKSVLGAFLAVTGIALLFMRY